MSVINEDSTWKVVIDEPYAYDEPRTVLASGTESYCIGVIDNIVAELNKKPDKRPMVINVSDVT